MRERLSNFSLIIRIHYNYKSEWIQLCYARYWVCYFHARKGHELLLLTGIDINCIDNFTFDF